MMNDMVHDIEYTKKETRHDIYRKRDVFDV